MKHTCGSKLLDWAEVNLPNIPKSNLATISVQSCPLFANSAIMCTSSVVFFCKSLVKPSSSIVSGCHWSGPSTSSTKMRCDDEGTLYLESVCVAGGRDSMKAAGFPAGGGDSVFLLCSPTSVDRRGVCEPLHNCGAFLSLSIDPSVIISPERKGNTHTLKIG